MSMREFANFVEKNIATLDELPRRYAEYRIATSQSYWDELRSLIRAKTPPEYTFADELSKLVRDWKNDVDEHVCGWARSSI